MGPNSVGAALFWPARDDAAKTRSAELGAARAKRGLAPLNKGASHVRIVLHLRPGCWGARFCAQSKCASASIADPWFDAMIDRPDALTLSEPHHDTQTTRLLRTPMAAGDPKEPQQALPPASGAAAAASGLVSDRLD